MTLLSRYRRQLEEEASGRSDTFARVLSWLRALWLVSVGLAILVLIYGLWVLVAPPHGASDGWAIIIAPVFATVIVVAGRIPLGLAQLFLSVKPGS